MPETAIESVSADIKSLSGWLVLLANVVFEESRAMHVCSSAEVRINKIISSMARLCDHAKETIEKR